MGNSLHELRLEDCMDAIIDYRGKPPKKTNSGIPLITAKIIKNGQIQEVKEFIAESDYDSWMRRGIPEAGDIVLTTEAPLGEVAQLDERKIALAQRVITLRGKKGLLDNDYLKYLLLSNDVQHQLDGRGTGTTVKGIKQSELREIILKFPDLPIQKSIAYILKILDDKIQLNKQTNQTLEKMAQALFKSWFVDFDPVFDNLLAKVNFKLENLPSDFPESLLKRAKIRLLALDDKEKAALTTVVQSQANIHRYFPSEFDHNEQLGWIPKGWAVEEAQEVADISIGKTPPRKQQEWFSDDSSGNIVWVSIKDMGGNKTFIGDSNEYLVPESIKKFNVKVIPKDSVILSFKLTLGRVCITKCDLATNEAIAHFVNLKHSLSKEYVYLYLKCFEYKSLGSTSSIATAVNSKIIKAMPFLVPSENVLNQFKNNVENIFLKIDSMGNQTNSLTKLRDALLPKLISGEIQLPVIEKLTLATNNPQSKVIIKSDV
jgi:type I restriction enzyme S subunit